MPASAGQGMSQTVEPCKVVILAGGFGTRLAERTDEIPKPMVQIGGRPMLWHILKIYSHFGHNDFIIAAGYKSEVVKRFFLDYREQMSDLVLDFSHDRIERINGTIEPWHIAIIDTGHQTMTGGRVRRLRPHLGDRTFMLTYGDGVADIDIAALFRFHKDHGKLATFTAVRAPSLFGVPVLEGDRVVRFAEKPTDARDWINGGFLVLEPDVMKYIAGDETSLETQTLAQLAEAGELMAFKHEGFWQPMDTLRDVRRLNTLWNENQAAWKLWN